MATQKPSVAYANPAADVAVRIAAQFGEEPQFITLAPEDWVGTEDIMEFLRVSEEMKDSAKDARLILR